MLPEHIHLPAVDPGFQPGPAFGRSNWYALRTRSRHEKRVAALLREKRIFVFLPLVQQMHRWSDRLAKVEVPLFGGYLFVRILPTTKNRLALLETPGAVGLVGTGKHWTAIPDREMESLQSAVQARAQLQVHPFVSAGKRVRIRGGALDGVEGIIAGEGPERSVVLSIELLRRSVSIRIAGYDLELV